MPIPIQMMESLTIPTPSVGDFGARDIEGV